MSDDFGTVSARREREIDVLRKHRESLVKMLADVDAQLRDLGEITTPVVPPPSSRDESLGSRPIVNTASWEEPDPAATTTQPGGGLRVLVILGIAAIALAVIGWLIWRASSDRPKNDAVIEETTAAASETSATRAADTAADTAAETEPGTIAPASALMRVTPRSQDYGLVRKGTRATRQFQFRNESDEPATIAVARSACRCLYYEYEKLVPPKATESITVTVDGARAKAGTLRESIAVTTKAGGTSFDVIATVR
ncbi:MAG TPA: DUF1573 domain-containing protein [Thermoanaerobaculia bacterium]|jgi:hypothetical protein|nr:DUF1573 domain-containing protein [Thermoanaerobaculia bacterium]